MTTVCVDKHGNIAADSQVSEGSLIVSNSFQKIRKFKSKEMGQVYVGIAGALSHAVELFDYIESVFDGTVSESEEPLKFISDCLQVLLLDEDGDVYGAEFTESSKGVHWVPIDKPASIGSGSHICIGALEAGLSAYDSVKIAALRDCFTNDNVMTYSYKDLAYDHIIEERIVELQDELKVLLESREVDLEVTQGVHTDISKLAQEVVESVDLEDIDMEEAHSLIEEVLEELKESDSGLNDFGEFEPEGNPWIPWEAKEDSAMPSWLTGDEIVELTFLDGGTECGHTACSYFWNDLEEDRSGLEGGTITAYRIHQDTSGDSE